MSPKPLDPETYVGERWSAGEYALHPDGHTWVFTLSVGGARHLFTMPAGGGVFRQITMGVKGFVHPGWSPDGSRIVAASKGGVWVMNPDGTDLRCVTRHAAGDDWPMWFPDGKRILFSSRRRGWNQCWSIDADGNGEALRHTPAARDYSHPRLSADGRRLACDSRCRKNLDRCEVWLFPADTSGEGVCITPPGDMWETNPTWSPDGKHLVLVSESPADGWARLHRVDPDHPFDRNEPLTKGPYEDACQPLVPMRFSRSGSRMAHLRVVEGAHELYVAETNSWKAQRVNAEPAFFQLLDFSPDEKTLYAVRQTPIEIPHLLLIDLDRGRSEAITPAALPGFSPEHFIKPTRVHYTNREGEPIEGWLWTPREVSENEAKKAPLVIEAHGGPHAFVRYDFNHHAQLLATNGYGILAVDFRGSTGHGRKHRQGHYRRWGEADVDDLLDGVEWSCKNLPWVERDRIGISGGSYGGYLVYCAITRAPEVFRCAVAASGDSEIYESHFHGDRSGRLDLEQQMGDPEKNRELYRQASPLYKAEDIQTPLMISHSKQDRSVVALMAERMLGALRSQSKFVDVRLYENPDHGGTGHGASTQENRLDQVRRTLKFLDKHLKSDGNLAE